MKAPHCFYCHSPEVVHNGSRTNKSKEKVQTFRCETCHKYFSERTGTPLEGLRTSTSQVAQALEARNEGTGLRAAARLAGVSHASVASWEHRIQRLGAGLQPPFSPGGPRHPGRG